MKDGFIQGSVLDGRFECIAPLNHGSFGMVFLAKDLKTNDHVAVKCILKPEVDTLIDQNGSDHLIELICHERLGYHPNIVNLVHAFESETHMYLVLEYCSMGDLYEAIRVGRGPLETKHVKDFMLELIDAVEFMHSKGLYHRDIKPENIFLAQDGSMKLGDFGLATTEDITYESCVGSDRYMAPEQYDPSDVGYSPAQADVWAIGICLLNILFSRNPFITPSEQDVLFTDFVRDRQSLFDVFPSMSQDTFEVLIHSMAIDPEKRSLSAMREAIDSVVSFTTDDDLFDDFCTEDPTVVPAVSANRQPLRTPSIQSPPVESSGAFPWAKALHMSPAHNRQLSVIPDTEDLFPEGNDWYNGACDTPSLASVLDSALGASIQSMKLKEPKPRNRMTSQAPVTGSLPVNVSSSGKAMASAFGKDTFSKSWSDLWDEEEEEVEDARRRFNERNWSNNDEDVTIRRSGLSEVKDMNVLNGAVRDLGIFADDIGNNNNNNQNKSMEHIPSCSPPKSSEDKWSALGNRRRATDAKPEDLQKDKRKRTNTGGVWRRGMSFGIKALSGNQDTGKRATSGNGAGERKANRSKPRNKAAQHKALEIDDWRKGAQPLDDTEWVGGWHDLHL
jgi:serine/threonine protein kinase